MIDINFQGIYDVISDTLPSEWNRVVVRCMRWEGSSEIVYYVRTNEREYKNCYSLGVPDEVLLEKSLKLLALMRNGESQWKVLTLMITADGSFNANVDYESDIDDTANYLKTWSDTYLK